MNSSTIKFNEILWWIKFFTDWFCKLKSIKSKLLKTLSVIGFIKKTLHNDVTPTFAKVKDSLLMIYYYVEFTSHYDICLKLVNPQKQVLLHGYEEKNRMFIFQQVS